MDGGRSLHWEPLITPSIWVALTIAACALLVLCAARRPSFLKPARWTGIILSMGLGVVLILALLLNPVWVEAMPPPPGKPVLTILVDKSASMAAPATGGSRSRLEEAVETAHRLAESASDRLDVRLTTFDFEVAAVDRDALSAAAADGGRTDLAGAIWSTVSFNRPAGQAMVLLSDGIDNAAGDASRLPNAIRLAEALTVPIYTKTIGGDADVQDISVSLWAPQELAFVDATARVSAYLSHRGLGGRRATVRLRSEGALIASESAILSDQQVSEVTFPISRENAGLYAYTVEVDPFPEEVTRLNNAHPFVLRVIDEPIRILLLEGKPYWDLKFLLRTLGSDPAVEMDSFVRLTEERMVRRSLARAAKDGEGGRMETWIAQRRNEDLLGSMDAIGEYQIIMLGRESDVFLTDDAIVNLRRWVSQEGGSLVCYRGAPVSTTREALGRMLPVRWTEGTETRFRMALTDRGADLGWLVSPGGEAGEVFSLLPSLATSAEISVPRPLAVVLATSSTNGASVPSPVVSYQPYGSGRVVAIEGAGMWRWAFLPPDYKQHDDVYPRVWQSLLRWLVSGVGLMPGQAVALRPDKAAFETQERVAATLLVREEQLGGLVPAVELKDERGTRTIHTPAPMGDEPGGFRVVFGLLAEGHYRAHVVGMDEEQIGASAMFEVRGFIGEQLDLKARPNVMARIAEHSGGAVLERGDASEITARFRAHQIKSRPQHVRRRPAWDRWWALSGVIGVWTVSWILRRTGGLT